MRGGLKNSAQDCSRESACCHYCERRKDVKSCQQFKGSLTTQPRPSRKKITLIKMNKKVNFLLANSGLMRNGSKPTLFQRKIQTIQVILRLRIVPSKEKYWERPFFTINLGQCCGFFAIVYYCRHSQNGHLTIFALQGLGEHLRPSWTFLRTGEQDERNAQNMS